jgi:thiol-disulfide isomerase/thioredoxin
MGVTAERFNQGMTYEEYKAQMTRNKERFEETEASVQLNPDDVAAFANLPQPLNVLVLAEDWCGDVISGLPALGKLAEASNGKLNIRVFLRDQNLDIMDQYLNRGEFRSIPVFVVFDQEFNEIGNMKERPESVTEMMSRGLAEIHANNPQYGPAGTPPDQIPEEIRTQYMAERNALRDRLRPQINQAIVDTMRGIVQGVAA